MGAEKCRKENQALCIGDVSLVNLVPRIKNDPDAYMELVSKTKPYVNAWLRKYGADIEEAERGYLADATYIEFLLYASSGTFLPIHDGQIYKCLKTITIRNTYDYVEKRSKQNVAEAGFMASQEFSDPIREVENAMDREKLASDKLHRRMMKLRASDKTYREIAEVVGLTLQQVAAFFYKLRKKAKKQ